MKLERSLEKYLEEVNEYLKPMLSAERADIINEIKSEMLERQMSGLGAEEILNRLGSAKDLAKAYVEEEVKKENKGTTSKFLSLMAFYSLSGLWAISVLPALSISSVAFIVSGVLSLIAGFLKFMAYLRGSDIPYIMIRIGKYKATAPEVFGASIVVGCVLWAAGILLWKANLKMVQYVMKKKTDLHS